MKKNKATDPHEIMICSPDDSNDKQGGSLEAKPKQNKSPLYKRILNILFFGIMLCALGIGGVLVWYGWPSMARYGELTRLMDRLVAGHYHQVLTAPSLLKKGADLDALRLLDRLKELGYTRSRTKESEAGRFFVDGGELYLSLHANASPANTRVRIRLRDSVVDSITDLATGREISAVTLEPLALTFFLDRIWEIRVPVSFAQLPSDLVNAVLATEDRKFFNHPGVDFTGILRAAYVNFQAGHVVQGGSTITQQLVKTLLDRHERTIEKKYEEALLALTLERRYSKKELLMVYLNNVYLGTAGSFEIRGMAAAANYIFGKDLSELNLQECAMLGGLIRSPNSASPLRNPERAADRLKTVLQQMAERGDPLAGEIPVKNKVRRIRHNGLLQQQVWFFDYLEQELLRQRILPAQFADGQLTIHTTLDPWLQTIAHRNMERELAKLEQRKRLATGALQGAIVTLDPHTGGILALVGGRNYRKSPFNRAVKARRQIGSLIKPFIYLAGLGGTNLHGVLTQATLIRDAPLAIRRGRSVWRPRNYDRRFKGEITARQALVESRNIPAIRVGRTVGLDNVVRFVRQLGISENPPRVPALFLGALESSPMQMAGAFATIANGGSRVVPHCISTVYRDKTLLFSAPRPSPMLAPGPCFVLTDMLTQVLESGTAARSRRMGFSQVAAGKTGTTNKLRDSWFAGFTPSLATVCWVGRDNNKPSRLTGSSGGLPVWVATMKAFMGKSRSENFAKPDSVWFADIDPGTGDFATWQSEKRMNMAFVKGMSPRQYSYLQEPFNSPGAVNIALVRLTPRTRKTIINKAGVHAMRQAQKMAAARYGRDGTKAGQGKRQRPVKVADRQKTKEKSSRGRWLLTRLRNATDWLQKKTM